MKWLNMANRKAELQAKNAKFEESMGTPADRKLPKKPFIRGA
jgi:hypothetical protein